MALTNLMINGNHSYSQLLSVP